MAGLNLADSATDFSNDFWPSMKYTKPRPVVAGWRDAGEVAADLMGLRTIRDRRSRLYGLAGGFFPWRADASAQSTGEVNRIGGG